MYIDDHCCMMDEIYKIRLYHKLVDIDINDYTLNGESYERLITASRVDPSGALQIKQVDNGAVGDVVGGEHLHSGKVLAQIQIERQYCAVVCSQGDNAPG